LHITSVSTGQITVGFCSCVAILTNYYLPIKRALNCKESYAYISHVSYFI
jgi:hypothetical protein